ncbi:hypothetical protein HN51_050269 [Arachis hypogaea]|nr:uncharacterized protein DS421_17g579760 [Arachis hypogaea]
MCINTINTNNTLQPQPLPSSMNNESLVQQPQQQMNSMSNNNYGSLSGNNPPTQSFYQSSGRPPLPNQMKTGRGNASNLIRHGSSPAGLFSNLNIEGPKIFLFIQRLKICIDNSRTLRQATH